MTSLGVVTFQLLINRFLYNTYNPLKSFLFPILGFLQIEITRFGNKAFNQFLILVFSC